MTATTLTKAQRATLDQIIAAGCARRSFGDGWWCNGWKGSGATRYGPSRSMMRRLIDGGHLVYSDAPLNDVQIRCGESAVVPTAMLAARKEPPRA